jgi:hypothetical protein
VSGLELVSITLTDADNEYRIFESLNAKGEPLSQADLLRNYVLMRLPAEHQQGIYARLWQPMQETLTTAQTGAQGDALADFFRYDYMGDGEFVREGDVYYAWKARLEKLTVTDLVQELDAIVQRSNYYARLIAPDRESDQAIRRGLARLNRWGAQTAYPFLLKVYREHQTGRIDAAGVAEIIRLIESFFVRRLLAGVSTRALNRLFLRLWQQLPRDRDVVAATRIVLSEPGRRWPRDEEFLQGILHFPLYSYGRAEQRRLILETLEESYAHKEHVDLAPLTVEHVMPQTLTAEWESMLGSDASVVHRRLVHTLGNLTLTGYNLELSNAPFEQKRERLAHSNLELNKEIARETTWTGRQIEDRARRLAERALQLWPGPDDSIGLPAYPETPVGVIRRVLTRMEVPFGQQALLGALYEAGDPGLTNTELCARLGRTRHELVGILGALGRRINNTPGADDDRGIGQFFQIEPAGSECRYHMLPALREALEAEAARGTLPPALAVRIQGPAGQT